MKQLWNDILTASENSSKACLATVIATEGTAPKKEGSKMLIIGGETLKGAVTIGGCIDAQVIEAAEEVTRTGEPKHLVESLNWQLYWFDRFLNGNANAIPPDAK